MPYLGRAPTGTGSVTEIDGDLKVTGQLTANDTLFKMILNGTDGSSTNASDNIIIEDGGTDGSGTDAGDDICIEKDTSNKVSGGNIVDLTGVTIDSTANVTGKVLQIVYAETTASSTGTTVMVNDDSIPQKTEGIEAITLAITPVSSTSRLVITGSILLYTTAAGMKIWAIFKDDGADAIWAGAWQDSDGSMMSLPVHFTEISANTTERTYKIRIGLTASYTGTLNGQSGSRRFGAIPKTNLQITEIEV